MRKLLITLFALVGLSAYSKADIIVADSAWNNIPLSSRDTLVYYPGAAFSAIPEAYALAEIASTDSTRLQPTVTLLDCQLQYTWVPEAGGIQTTEPLIIALLVNESGASYEVRYAPTEPQSVQTTDLPRVSKILRNGQVVILRNGENYSIIGQKL